MVPKGSEQLADCPYAEPGPPQPTHPPCILKLLFNILSNLRIGFPSGFFPSGFANVTLQTHALSPLRATCLSHHIPLDLIIRTLLDKECRLFSPDSSLRSIELIHLHCRLRLSFAWFLTFRRLMSYIYIYIYIWSTHS